MEPTKVLIVIVVTVVLIAVAATVESVCDKGPCRDYVIFVSAAPGSPSTASCKPGMTMTTKDKWQGVRVTCTCPK